MSVSVRAQATADSRPVDLAHLAKQTMGNRDLEREVLHLFLKQSVRTLAKLAEPGADRAGLAHVIVGSARGIGAWEVAKAAEALESATRQDPASGDGLIADVQAAVERANGFIRTVV
ncbi:Hpt domain-containing protein [Chthonobacter albigriseus]|uniref:Hpt domain-containing protein n=1 Tax=Chthonobacter albigriseus TaxID=1683161 RepID=UPI0015EEF9BA|nr:Hpt domain-containing protein [Chthonobacter albigriseus]